MRRRPLIIKRKKVALQPAASLCGPCRKLLIVLGDSLHCGVDPALPATHPVRAGQALFVTQCLPCHTLNGAGSSNVGPDMNQPMNPTEYLTHDGLHALIRDPRSVRNWPGLLMPGFAPDQMSDREIDLVIDYLAHMATRRTSR